MSSNHVFSCHQMHAISWYLVTTGYSLMAIMALRGYGDTPRRPLGSLDVQRGYSLWRWSPQVSRMPYPVIRCVYLLISCHQMHAITWWYCSWVPTRSSIHVVSMVYIVLVVYAVRLWYRGIPYPSYPPCILLVSCISLDTVYDHTCKPCVQMSRNMCFGVMTYTFYTTNEYLYMVCAVRDTRGYGAYL